MTDARCWKIFHGLTEQLLAVYPGTPTADVLAAVRELFGFRETAPLRFRNVDGLPVAVSSHLPDNVALHVSVEAGFPLPPASSNPTGTVRRASAEPGADSAVYASSRCATPAFGVLSCQSTIGARMGPAGVCDHKTQSLWEPMVQLTFR